MPTGYRSGMTQQPYTKYESDNDGIKVEYRRMESVQRMFWLSGYKGTTLRILILVIIFLFGLVLGYVMRRNSRLINAVKTFRNSTVSPDEAYGFDLSKELHGFISAESLEQNLRSYTSEVHISGTGNNNHLADYLHYQLRQLHLVVKESKYKVLLSYHDWERLSSVRLINANGSVEYQTEYRGPQVNGDPRSADHPEVTQSFMAYSSNGSAQGELVYANFGEEKDFLVLREKGVSCQGKIVIMRLGRIFPGHMVKRAEKCGAVGVILYSDPQQVSNSQHMGDVDPGTFPATHLLPGWAAQRGTLWHFGDPLTPGVPSIDGVYRVPVTRVALPSIPVVPVSYDDASHLMSSMKGPMDVEDFAGSMKGNVTYGLGPGYHPPKEDWRVKMDVFNDLETREITNIIGILKGNEEPDSYIIVGCHYDAWTYGGVDPNSGTAILMEITKAFDRLLSRGWQPRRTIVFAHWDAGEMGHIGSYEWVEEFVFELRGQTVAYVNLNEAVSGKSIFDVESFPMLRSLLVSASRQILINDKTFATLHEFWVEQQTSSELNSDHQLFRYPSPDGNQAAFLQYLGVPVFWPKFRNTVTRESRHVPYPAYHTAIDGFEYVKKFVDPSFETHVTLAQFVAEVILQLSSPELIPLDVRELSEMLRKEFSVLLQGTKTKDFKRNLDHLQWAIENFTKRSSQFYYDFNHQTISSSRRTELYNKRLMKFLSAFVVPNLNNQDPTTGNIFFDTSADCSPSCSLFSRLQKTFEAYLEATDEKTRNSAKEDVDRLLSATTLAIQSAAKVLTTTDIFP